MAKQPFYHRGDVLFSASKPLDQSAFQECFKAALTAIRGYVRDSAMIEVSAKPKKKTGSYMHCSTVLFTATREVDTQELKAEMARTLGQQPTVDLDSIRVSSYDAEAGDPIDL